MLLFLVKVIVSDIPLRSALGVGCLLTVALYAVVAWLGPRIGVSL